MTAQPAANGRGRIPADTLSNRIVLARRLAGMTIEEAAEATGLSQSSWANWENGMRPQRETDVIQTIADVLDIDREWLMLGGPLTPARGKPTKRTARRDEQARSETATLLPLALSPTSGPEPYPRRAERAVADRPKGRVDPSRPMSAATPGRRAAPIR